MKKLCVFKYGSTDDHGKRGLPIICQSRGCLGEFDHAPLSEPFRGCFIEAKTYVDDKPAPPSQRSPSHDIHQNHENGLLREKGRRDSTIPPSE